MSKEELLNALSDININSETGLEAVSLYIKFLYFDTFMSAIITVVIFSLITVILILLFRKLDQL